MTFMELPSVRQAKILYILNIIIIIELKNVTSLSYLRNNNINVWNSSEIKVEIAAYQMYNTHRNNDDFSRFSLTAVTPIVSPCTHSFEKIQIISKGYMFRSSWKVVIHFMYSVGLHLAPPFLYMTKYSVIVSLLPKKSCSQLTGVNLDLIVRSLVPQYFTCYASRAVHMSLFLAFLLFAISLDGLRRQTSRPHWLAKIPSIALC